MTEIPKDLSLYEKGMEVLHALAPFVQASPSHHKTYAELVDLVRFMRPEGPPSVVMHLQPPLTGPEASKALEVLRRRYRKAAALNIFDRDAEDLVRAALALALAVLQDRCNEVAEGYVNSGADSSPDLDALEEAVDLLQVPEPLSAILWSSAPRKGQVTQ